MTHPLDRWPGMRFPVGRMSRRDAAVVLIAAVVSLLLQGRDIQVPVIPGDAVVRSSALLPLLLTVPLVASSVNPMPELEAMSAGPRLLLARVGWGAGLASVAAVVSALAAADGDPEGMTALGAALNALCLAGLGLICSAGLGADLAWTGPCLLALVTFFFGKDLDNQVRAWAWLLHGPAAPAAWGLSVGLFLAGVVAYALLDSTGLLQRKLNAR